MSSGVAKEKFDLFIILGCMALLAGVRAATGLGVFKELSPNF
jgi:hypothetical protein